MLKCRLCRRSACARYAEWLFHEITSTRGFDFFPRNQRGPVSHDLADRRTAVAEPGRAGRAVEHQRNQLAREAVDGFAVLPAHADAQLNSGGSGFGGAAGPVAGVHAEELGVDFFELEAERGEPRAHNAVGRAGFSSACGQL
jgi:hypothetical protein